MTEEVAKAIKESNLPEPIKEEVLQYMAKQGQHGKWAIAARTLVAVLVGIHEKHGPGAVMPLNLAHHEIMQKRMADGFSPKLDVDLISDRPCVKLEWV